MSGESQLKQILVIHWHICSWKIIDKSKMEEREEEKVVSMYDVYTSQCIECGEIKIFEAK